MLRLIVRYFGDDIMDHEQVYIYIYILRVWAPFNGACGKRGGSAPSPICNRNEQSSQQLSRHLKMCLFGWIKLIITSSCTSQGPLSSVAYHSLINSICSGIYPMTRRSHTHKILEKCYVYLGVFSSIFSCFVSFFPKNTVARWYLKVYKKILDTPQAGFSIRLEKCQKKLMSQMYEKIQPQNACKNHNEKGRKR